MKGDVPVRRGDLVLVYLRGEGDHRLRLLRVEWGRRTGRVHTVLPITQWRKTARCRGEVVPESANIWVLPRWLVVDISRIPDHWQCTEGDWPTPVWDTLADAQDDLWKYAEELRCQKPTTPRHGQGTFRTLSET